MSVILCYIPSNMSKGAPIFYTVRVIHKGKVQSERNAVRAAPTFSPLRARIQSHSATKPLDAATNEHRHSFVHGHHPRRTNPNPNRIACNACLYV